MSLAKGHTSPHAAQALFQRDHFRIPGGICQAPSLRQGLHLVRPDQLNHWYDTVKAGWAGRESFDSRSVVLSFKPLTGGLSQNGTTILNIYFNSQLGASHKTRFQFAVPLFLHTKVFHNKTPANFTSHPHPTTLGKQRSCKTRSTLFLLKLVEVAGLSGVSVTPLHVLANLTGSHRIGPPMPWCNHWATPGPAPPRHDHGFMVHTGTCLNHIPLTSTSRLLA